MRLAYPKKEKGKEKQPNKLFVSLTLMVYWCVRLSFKTDYNLNILNKWNEHSNIQLQTSVVHKKVSSAPCLLQKKTKKLQLIFPLTVKWFQCFSWLVSVTGVSVLHYVSHYILTGIDSCKLVISFFKLWLYNIIS